MNCDLCGSQELVNVLQPSSTHHGYMKCKDCGVFSTLDRIEQQTVDTEPAQENHRFNALGEALFRVNSLLRYRHVLRTTAVNVGKMLDYGCGRGDLINRFQNSGWEVFGTEFSEETAKEARVKHKNVLVKTDYEFETIDLFGNQEFNLITSFHNLEHLDHPGSFIAECSRVLKNGGYLVIEVPNYESWQSRIDQWDWIYLDPGNHRYHLNKKGLRVVLQNNGFVIERESTFSFTMGSIGMTFVLINRIRKEKNALFYFMRTLEKSDKSNYRTFLEALLFVVMFPLGLTFELVAALFKSGAVIRIVARRR